MFFNIQVDLANKDTDLDVGPECSEKLHAQYRFMAEGRGKTKMSYFFCGTYINISLTVYIISFLCNTIQ
jgi:hypothetical protein